MKFRSLPDTDNKLHNFSGLDSLHASQPDNNFRNEIKLDNSPGLTISVNPTNLKLWLSGRNPGAKELPFAYELAILHKTGIIDAFSIPKIGEDVEALRNTARGIYDYLVRAAVRLTHATALAAYSRATGFVR